MRTYTNFSILRIFKFVRAFQNRRHDFLPCGASVFSISLKGGVNGMAIYHLKMKTISRGKGQNAIASASYRSGDSLYCERTGETKNYNRKVKPDSHILAPSHAPSWVLEREKLWNEVEFSEKRGNSRVAREVVVAIPRELSIGEQRELVLNFAKDLFVEKGMIADVSIHRDHSDNPHAHIMLTTREISEEGFTVKNRSWDEKSFLLETRKAWSEYANLYLEKEGIQDRIDHRSYEDQGKDLLPTEHLGHIFHQLEQRGIQTRIGDKNRKVKEYNQRVISLKEKREHLLNSLEKQGHKKETDQVKIISLSKYEAIKTKLYFLTKDENRLKWKVANNKISNRLFDRKIEKINSSKEALEFEKQSYELQALYTLEHTGFEVYLNSLNPEQRGEIAIRVTNKMKEIDSDDTLSIIESIEKDIVFENVQGQIKGFVTYERLEERLEFLNKIDKNLDGKLNRNDISHEEYNQKKDNVSSQINDIEKAKSHYELQALSYITRNGLGVYLDECPTEKQGKYAVKILDKIKHNPSLNYSNVVREINEDELLEKATNIVRNNLTSDNFAKRLKQLNYWKLSCEKKQDNEKVEKAKEDISTLLIAKKVIIDRMQNHIKSDPELYSFLEEDGTLLDSDKKDILVDLHLEKMKNNDLTRDEEFTIVSQKMIAKSENKVLNLANKHLKDKVTYKTVINKIEEIYTKSSDIKSSNLKAEIDQLKSYYDEIISKHEIVQKTGGKLFKSRSDKENLKRIEEWFTKEDINPNNVSYALQKVKWNMEKVQRQISKQEKIENVVLPTLLQAKQVLEEQAIRYVEKTYNYKDLYVYSHLLDEQERKLMVQIKDWNESTGSVYDFKDKQKNLKAILTDTKLKQSTLKEQYNEIQKTINLLEKSSNIKERLPLLLETKEQLENKSNTFKRTVLKDQETINKYEMVMKEIKECEELIKMENGNGIEVSGQLQGRIQELKQQEQNSYNQYQNNKEKEGVIESLLNAPDVLEQVKNKVEREAEIREFEHQNQLRRNRMKKLGKHRGIDM